jgi:hypothetical protein
MRDKRRSLAWWWLLLLVVIFASLIGYLILARIGREPEPPLVAEKLSSVEALELPEETPNTVEEKEEIPSRLAEEQPSSRPFPNEAGADYCFQIEQNVLEFFRYLDTKKYVRDLNPMTDIYSCFKKILRRLAAQPPIPAGEGADPKMIVQNIYHLYRVLDWEDLRLIREIIRNERETLEFNLEMFYRWLCSRDQCPDPEGLRPSMEVLYRYSGFFINTTGGRAYLFRRSSDIRLLMSYYCLLIIHAADKEGKNNYGIDIAPYISPLRDEFILYPDFQFQSEYINQLSKIESYYALRR